MRKESRSELLQEALDFLDEDMIEEVDRLRRNQVEKASDSTAAKKQAETVSKSKIKRFPWRRITALTASLCLLVIGSRAWKNYVGTSAEDKMNKEDMEYNDGYPAIMDSQQAVKENGVADKVDGVAEEGVPDNVLSDYESGNKTEEAGPVLGDKYDLQNNYVNVSMIPHKVWEQAASEEEALQQAVAINAEYKEGIDRLVEAMCIANCVLTEELPASDTDMIYHLFFERTDGEVVHCWLLEDGFLYYHDISDVCLSLDKATYGEILNILAMHW